MAKKKPRDTTEEPRPYPKETYQQFIKHHNKKLRQAIREANGENMDRPPSGDYGVGDEK